LLVTPSSPFTTTRPTSISYLPPYISIGLATLGGCHCASNQKWEGIANAKNLICHEHARASYIRGPASVSPGQTFISYSWMELYMTRNTFQNLTSLRSLWSKGLKAKRRLSPAISLFSRLKSKLKAALENGSLLPR
jgi:hypothetical protein